MITQTKSKRSSTGGRYKNTGKSKLYERGRKPLMSKIGEKRVRKEHVKAGLEKQRVLQTNIINVYNPKTKKYQQVTVKSVAENPANRNYVRRNILTKGTIVETEAGKARITNRPGQEGSVQAVLV
jgi:small subunit ribosomal protein S8e